jgi:site-specific recombinase XerD
LKRKRTKFEKAKTKENILDDDHIILIKNHADRLERFIFLALLYTGMRVSEFIHFRREWIRWEQGLIFIPKRQSCRCQECKRELRNKKGEITKPSGVWKPKTVDAARGFPILPEVEGLFRDYFKEHRAVMEVVASRVYAWMILKKLEAKSSVKLFPHVLRGTFATLLAVKGFSVEEIRDFLGWRSFKTADEYIKLSGIRLRRAVQEKWK